MRGGRWWTNALRYAGRKQPVLNMELCKLDVGLEKYIYLDPETNFWAYADVSEEEDVLRLFRDVRDELLKEMLKCRFEVRIRTVYLNVTDRCNANCPYCYIPEYRRKNGVTMKKEELYSYLNEFLEKGVEWVIFHGAEPMIAKNLIFDAMDDFSELKFGVQTNGFLLEEEDVKFLVDRRVNIGISFDSPYREVEDFLRGKGHYDKVMEVLEFCGGYDRFSVITTINKHNFTHLEKMVDLLAGKVPVLLMNIVRGTSETGRELRVDASEQFIKAVERAINHTKNGRRIVIGDFANYLLGILAPSARVLQCDVSPCGAGRRFISLATDGFYPCSEFVGLKEFRVKDFDSAVKTFENVRNRTVEKIEECRDCPLRNICGSPCPAEVYSEYGTFFKKSPSCDYYKRVIEHAFKVLVRGDYKYVLKMENLKEKFSWV